MPDNPAPRLTWNVVGALTATFVLANVPFRAEGAVALAPPTIADVADGKPAFGDTAFGAPPSRGNDGVSGGGNWTHADYPTSGLPYPGEATNAPNPYWEVDLLGSFDLQSVAITDREACCDPNRLDGSIVTFFDAGGSAVGSENISGLAGTTGQVVNFNNAGAGYSGVSRIRIDGVNGGAPIQYFQFSELDALAEVVSPINWAANMQVGMFDSTGALRGTWPGFPASNLTDGSLATISHGENQPDHDSWYFEVDLAQEIFVDNIDLTGRGFSDDCCPERLRDYQVQLLDGTGTATFTYDHNGTTQFTDNLDVIGMTGGTGPRAQFVRIINTDNTQFSPQVGEVEVYGIAVPEPSAVIIVTLVGAVFGLRRRR